MSRKHLAVLAIALAALSDPVAAELRGTPEGPPLFTAADVAVIARNPALATIIQEHPWTVRRLLDALAALEPGATADRSAPRAGDQRGISAGPAAAGERAPVDPQANPDLDELQRTSPEAVLDLFEILKRAQATKSPRPAKQK